MESKKEKSWLSSLVFWKSAEPPKPEQYQIRVSEEKSGSLVNVLSKDGDKDAPTTSNRILTLLYNQLK